MEPDSRPRARAPLERDSPAAVEATSQVADETCCPQLVVLLQMSKSVLDRIASLLAQSGVSIRGQGRSHYEAQAREEVKQRTPLFLTISEPGGDALGSTSTL